jgi:hypothetical protein
MKLVNPEGRLENSRSRTLTERIKELSLTSSDLIDAGFLMLLGLVALAGFIPTFDTLHFLLVGAVGLLLGMITAHLVVSLRWHWVWIPVILVVAYFVFGAGLAAHEYAIAGFVPSLPALVALAAVAVNGWKEMITTLPPLVGDGIYLALPYLMTLVTGAVGLAVARRSRQAAAALVVPVVLLLAVTLLGTRQTMAPLIQGLVLAALGFAWLAVRNRRRRHLTGTGRSQRAGLAAGVGLLGAALVLGGLFGGLLPGAGTPRWVLREYVQPPIEVKDLSSPLVGFRLYSSQNLRQLWDSQLLTVTGAAPNSLLRIAVLDDYTGHTWSASGGNGSGSGFQRIGARIPDVTSGTPTPVTITFAADYERTRELGPWLPSLGGNTAISFAGANLKTHASSLRYNLDTGQGLLTEGDRFRDGDVLQLSTVPMPAGFDANSVPGGAPTVAASAYSFLASTGQKWGGATGTPAQQVIAIAQVMKNGYWSDGTGNGEADYLPGHSQGRLTNFVLGEDLVGSDEQYAATFALLCNQVGFPARTVFGAIVPEGGVVKGQNVTAWVEVETDQGWQAIAPQVFTPDRNRTPDQLPQTRSQDKNATNVPPPNTSRADTSPLDSTENDMNGTKVISYWWSGLLKALLVILGVVGPPIAVVAAVLTLIAVAKTARRHRRRTSGTASKQVAAAWRDVFDQCRDLGMVLSASGTRLEQARVIRRAEVNQFAVAANTATFGLGDPSAEEVAGLWSAAAATRKQLLNSVGGWQRIVARFNLRSLLPERLASAELPRLDLQPPHWLNPSGRRIAGGQPDPGGAE